MARRKTQSAPEVLTSTSSSRAMARARLARVLCGGLLLAGLSTGCGKSLAGNLEPDFSGLWDVTYDDTIEVQVQLGEQVLRDSLGDQGGQLAFHDAGVEGELNLQLDCARSELVCPGEVWPRELDLQQAPGRLDHDGMQLVQSLESRGTGRCTTLPGSLLTGEVMSVASVRAVRSEAVAVTSGRVRIVLGAACFDSSAGLPADARVVLSTGYTAAKR